MPPFDLPLDQLRGYQSDQQPPDDFDAFWEATLAEARAAARPAEFVRGSDPLFRTVAVHDVTFSGFAGDAIRGWLITPADAPGPLPCVVQFVGYGGGRSTPLDHLHVATAGLAHFIMDTRGQGAGWSAGSTGDPHPANGPSVPGFLTRGIEDPRRYYYRRLITDAVCAVTAAGSHAAVDAERIAVSGASQGGGLALAAAGLCGDAVRALICDVPFLCNYRRALELTDAEPYAELSRYLAVHRGSEARVLETLRYFDGLHFAPKVTAPSLLSVGLCDLICPPSTVFSVCNRIPAPRRIEVYRYNGHEGGGVTQRELGLRFALQQLLG